jgi:hypothetical protein
VVHHGNPEDWGPGAPWVKRQTSARERHHAGYLEDYQDTSRGRWSGPLKTPEQKRAFQEGRDIPEETAPDNINNLHIALARGEYTDKAGIPRGVPDELKGISGERQASYRHLWHSGAPEGWAPLTEYESHGRDAVRRHNDPQNVQGTQNLDEYQLRDLSDQRKDEW